MRQNMVITISIRFIQMDMITKMSLNTSVLSCRDYGTCSISRYFLVQFQNNMYYLFVINLHKRYAAVMMKANPIRPK